MTATSFTLKWLPSESDGGSKILEYIVEIREAEAKEWKKIGASKEDITELPISNLKTSVAYNFKITARNKIGLSEPFMPEDKIIAGQRLSTYTLFVCVCSSAITYCDKYIVKYTIDCRELN